MEKDSSDERDNSDVESDVECTKDVQETGYDSGYDSTPESWNRRRNRAHYPEYVLVNDRLRSFDRYWPDYVSQTPQMMVESGFFFAGYEDCVRCFQCGIGLRNWEPQDNPHVEHARWSPKCPFLLGVKGQDFINLVLDAVAQLALRNEQSANTPPTHGESNPDEVVVLQQTSQQSQHRNTSNSQPNITSPQNSLMLGNSEVLGQRGYDSTRESWNRRRTGISDTQTASQYTLTSTNRNRTHFPEYVLVNDRLRSFDRGWPDYVSQTPQMMVESGFFFAGYEDCVRCFQCGVGLRNWEPQDNPHVEHARWSPKCPFLLGVKGQDFINLVLDAVAQLALRNEQSANTPPTHGESNPDEVVVLQQTSQQSQHRNTSNMYSQANITSPQNPLMLGNSEFLGHRDPKQNKKLPVTKRKKKKQINLMNNMDKGKDKCQKQESENVGVLSQNNHCDAKLEIRLRKSKSDSLKHDKDLSWVSRILLEFRQKFIVNIVVYAPRIPNNIDYIVARFMSPDPPTKRETMAYELLRLCNLNDFPKPTGQSCIRLAQAGFFYEGNDDEVTCFSCSIKICGWQPQDMPLDRHREASPNCLFIKGQNSGNVPICPTEFTSESAELNKATSTVSRNSGASSYPDSLSCSSSQPSSSRTNNRQQYITTTESSSSRDITDTQTVTQSIVSTNRNRAHYPEYVLVNDRLRSFDRGWPDYLSQTPQMMVESGFFYHGLRNWDPDEIPHEEHARWSPKCPFLLEVKGQDFINLVLNAAHLAARNEESADTSTNNISASQEPQQRNDPDTTELRSINQQLREMQICKICRTDEVAIAFLPCGDLVVCRNCAGICTNCPKCNKPITETIPANLDV